MREPWVLQVISPRTFIRQTRLSGVGQKMYVTMWLPDALFHCAEISRWYVKLCGNICFSCISVPFKLLEKSPATERGEENNAKRKTKMRQRG